MVRRLMGWLIIFGLKEFLVGAIAAVFLFALFYLVIVRNEDNKIIEAISLSSWLFAVSLAAYMTCGFIGRVIIRILR